MNLAVTPLREGDATAAGVVSDSLLRPFRALDTLPGLGGRGPFEPKSFSDAVHIPLQTTATTTPVTHPSPSSLHGPATISNTLRLMSTRLAKSCRAGGMAS